MANSENNSDKKNIFTKLKNKYRLVILNSETFEEKLSLWLSPLNVFVWVGIALIIWIVIITFVVAFTPLREFIPGYADVNLRRNALRAVLKADSISLELSAKSNYLENLNSILLGKISTSEVNNSEKDTTKKYDNIRIKKSKEDSLLRLQIEAEDQYNLALSEDKTQQKSISSFFFFTPLNGKVTHSYNSIEQHYGVDIAAAENEAIKATLDGTVVLASWTSDNGYVMQIQHENNLISVYKHNSALMKKVGDNIKAGEVIAIVGNSGELTSGTHLHFEIWNNGNSLNPQDYIVF